MKIKFKFWKRQIDFKTKRLDKDEKIAYLANELVKELSASGRSMACPDVAEGFGSLTIFAHRIGGENPDITIENRFWDSMKITPTFKSF